MFWMSLKSVPGCLVSIEPRAIGVPVACAPGLVPQADALTVLAPAPEVALDCADGVLELLELRLLHPAAAATASTAIAMLATDERRRIFLFIRACLFVA